MISFLLRNWRALLALAAGAAFVIFSLHIYDKGYDNGYAEANSAAEKATEKAMEELANDADKARFERRLCVERGGVWSFADNKCSEG